MTRSRIAWIGLLALALMQTSCVEVENPLQEPEKAEVDKQLVGRWKSTDPKANGDDLVIAQAKELKNAPAGLMELVELKAKPGGGKSEKMYVFASQVGKDRYLHLAVPKKEGAKLTEWNKADTTYMILKYKVDGDNWTFWLMDPDETAKVIDAGKLKGTVKKLEFGKEVKLQESSAGLRKYLEEGGAKTVYPDKNKQSMVRVK